MLYVVVCFDFRVSELFLVIKLIYLTPEQIVIVFQDNQRNRLKSMFISLFKRKLLVRFAIDEAHTVFLNGGNE